MESRPLNAVILDFSWWKSESQTPLPIPGQAMCDGGVYLQHFGGGYLRHFITDS